MCGFSFIQQTFTEHHHELGSDPSRSLTAMPALCVLVSGMLPHSLAQLTVTECLLCSGHVEAAGAQTCSLPSGAHALGERYAEW